jgi:excisionase family DNA binding protein
VAATLEQRWNASLARVHELEDRIVTLTADAERQVAPDRVVLLQLAEDFPRVWDHPSTDIRTRKRIVRLLIEEIVVKVVAGAREQIELTIHWKGGHHTQLTLLRNRTGQHRRSTDRAVVDVVRDLARAQSDGNIARELNRLGYRTGAGNTWTALRVLSLRRSHGIAVFERTSDRRDVLTIADAATMLGVSAPTVRRMIVLGMLPATQPVVHAPWAIRKQDLGLDAVQRAVNAIKAGRALPRSQDEGQLTLAESTT